MTVGERRRLYLDLLSTLGGYFFHYAHDPEGDGWVEYSDDEKFKTVMDWIQEGKEPVVRAFFVWEVGNASGAYDYCKDMRMVWNADEWEWEVEKSEPYVIGREENASAATPREPVWLD